MQFKEEKMSDAMMKYHVDGAPFAAVFHRFTEPDHSGPHDHPWPFQSTIMHGSYIERIWTKHKPTGIWCCEDLHRKKGETFKISATHIHQIIDLPDGECWTFIRPGNWERVSRQWHFSMDGKTALSKAWNETEWSKE